MHAGLYRNEQVELRRSDDDAVRRNELAHHQGDARATDHDSKPPAMAMSCSTEPATTGSSMSPPPTHHIFDGLTFRNTDIAIFAGFKNVTGALPGSRSGTAASRTSGSESGPSTQGSSDFYIADNIFLGRTEQRNLLVGWTGFLCGAAPGPYGSHEVRSYYAVKVYGPGHVIAHNAVAYFHDGIGISTYGTPAIGPGTACLVNRHLRQ